MCLHVVIVKVLKKNSKRFRSETRRKLIYYSRPSVARILKVRLPRLFGIVLESFAKNPIAADLGLFKVIFFSILKMVFCVY